MSPIYDGATALTSTIIPARRYGVRPNTGTNMTTAIQTALDDCPTGSTLAFEPGDYICNGVTVTRDKTNIYLPSGSTLKATSATAKAVMTVDGTVNTSTSYTTTTLPTAGSRTITVTAGVEANFPAGSWLMVEDDEVPANGLPSDPNMEYWKHCELAQVHSTASGAIFLRTPLINTYANVGSGDPRIRAVTPISEFNIHGGGKITNAQAGTGEAHGIRLFYTVGARVDRITFEQCWDSGFHATRSTEIVVSDSTFQNAVVFNSRGYGFTCHASTRVTLGNNVFKRLRHHFDFSTFSRLCTATGNVCIASSTGNVNLHPSVHDVTITGNVIDGAHGEATASGGYVYDIGDSSTQGSGINIDEGCKNVIIANNTIRNCRLSGVYIDAGHSSYPTEYITIEGNTIENCCLYRPWGSISNHAGIAAMETWNGGTTRRGIVIRGNILREPGGYGIIVGLKDALVEGNWIYKASEKLDTPGVGIGIWARNASGGSAVSGIQIRNNVISECIQNGIRVGVNAGGVNVSDCVVEGNLVRECGSLGTFPGIFTEETAVGTIIRNNVCLDNSDNGIGLQGPSGWVTGNRSSGSGGYGLELVSTADSNLVRDNIYSDNDDGAFRDLAQGTVYGDVPASIWGAIPDTGGDMTAQINASLADCPLGATLVYEPGTYLISDTIWLSRTINLLAKGVVFDLGTNVPTTTFSPGIPENHNGTSYLTVSEREAGTLTNKAAFVWGTSGGNRPARNWIRGLTVKRTAADNTAAARLYAGIVLLAPYECQFDDPEATNFREGIVLLGGTSQGCAYDTITNPKTNDCRYGITLYCNRASGGWVNQNSVHDGRVFVSSTVRADPSWNLKQWECIRLLWESGGTSPSGPNNNHFMDVTVEGSFGRKVRVEGGYNRFDNLRYEGIHAGGSGGTRGFSNNDSTLRDITVGESSRLYTWFSYNQFIGGRDLPGILDNDNLEFLATSPINDGNSFICGTADWHSMRSGNARANYRWTTSSLTAPVAAFGTYDDKETIRIFSNAYASLGALGTFEFCDSTVTVRNAIGMKSTTPYDLVTMAGVDIADVLHIGLDGTSDAIIQNSESGKIFINSANSIVTAYSSYTSNNDVFIIGDSNRDARITMKAQDSTPLPGYLGVIKFHDDDVSATWLNTIGVDASSNLGGQRPLLVQYGIDINHAGADADTRVQGDTDVNLTYWDASADAVGIGTSTPGAKLEILKAGEQLRLRYSSSSGDYTSLTELDRTGFYGGLAIEPPSNSSSLKWLHIFGQSDSTGLSMLDDGTNVYAARTTMSRNLFFACKSDKQMVFEVGPGGTQAMVLQTAGVDFLIPGSYRYTDSGTSNVVTPLYLYHQTSATPPAVAAGFGVGQQAILAVDSGGTRYYRVASQYDQRWETATYNSEDSSIRFHAMDAGTLKEIVRIEGSLPGVMIHANATAVPAERLDIDANVRCQSLRLDGDTGSGVASTVTHTNLATAVGGSTGTATLGLCGNSNTPTGVAQTHWLKFYDGTTVRYIPVWT